MLKCLTPNSKCTQLWVRLHGLTRSWSRTLRELIVGLTSQDGAFFICHRYKIAALEVLANWKNVFGKWKIFIATVMVEMSIGDYPRYLSLSQIEKMSSQSRIWDVSLGRQNGAVGASILYSHIFLSFVISCVWYIVFSFSKQLSFQNFSRHVFQRNKPGKFHCVVLWASFHHFVKECLWI